jgi:hypothetical protein
MRCVKNMKKKLNLLFLLNYVDIDFDNTELTAEKNVIIPAKYIWKIANKLSKDDVKISLLGGEIYNTKEFNKIMGLHIKL